MARFKLGIRPKPKPNCNSIKINSNKTSQDFNDEKEEKPTTLGNVGDVSTLIWLYCDLQPYGKRIVRQGWREGLDKTKPPIWTFCPLLHFPRDRKLCEECKTCPHYKGVSRDLSTINDKPQDKNTTPFNIHMIPRSKKEPKKSFSKEQVEEETRKREQEQKEWEEEEKRISKGES